MFVALDKLSRYKEESDLAALPPSGQRYRGRGPPSHQRYRGRGPPSHQRYRGRGPSQREDQQEPRRPVTRSTATAQIKAQRSGGLKQQPVKKGGEPEAKSSSREC